MATSQMSGVIQHLRRAVLLRDGAGLTDGQLLEDYLSRREEAALAALVRRHGPMVWGVCRRVLRNYHDAEDAFQATFLVLVRKAASIASPELLANWLYGVAHQTALKARATTAKRRGRERQVTEMPEPAVIEQDPWHDLQPLLDQELSRLPDKYRVAIVLCDLEGKTRKEAARQLGVPEGTLAARLARGRVMLAKRLARHGLAVSGGSLAAVLSQNAASACVPTSVVSSTIKAASLVAAGQAATAGLISVKVAALTEGVVKAMLVSKLKMATVVLLFMGMVGGGLGLLTHQALAQKPTSTKQEGTPTAKAENDKDKKDTEKAEKQPDLSGVIAAVSNDFRTLTLDLPPQIKGDPPTSVEIKLTDKTKLIYFGVDGNGETPTVGYTALVWLVKDSKDTAAAVKLGRKEGLDEGKGHDFVGQITAVAKDGKSISVEVAPENKGDEPKKVEIKLTDKTKFSYFGVDQAGETPTVGYVVLVWLVKESKDTAAGVRLGLKN